MEKRISTGASFLDVSLGGGYECGVITTLYGPGGSGKTNLCILAMIRVAGTGKKIIYVDTESSLSIERLRQITKHYRRVLYQTILFTPSDFDEQKSVLFNLGSVCTDKVGLIVIDSIAMLYRLALGESDDVYNVNAELGRQITYLLRLAKKFNICVLVTNQVYSDFFEREKVNMVGGDLLKNGSRCLIELQCGRGSIRRAILRKHRSLSEQIVDFKIVENGVLPFTVQ